MAQVQLLRAGMTVMNGIKFKWDRKGIGIGRGAVDGIGVAVEGLVGGCGRASG